MTRQGGIMIRKPAVAGQFYPAQKELLRKTVDEFLDYGLESKTVLGLGAPHAGYIYSGATAGHTYASAIIPNKCIILSPNHTGAGAKAAIFSEGTWSTPLGDIPIDDNLSSKLMEKCSLLQNDFTAHIAEHSLEVQLPFLQERQPDLSIVPITLQYMSYAECETIGKVIAEVIKESNEEILVIASTDMNHYENQETTKEKDKLAIDRILELSPEELLNTCGNNNITMCGVISTAIMLIACKELGAKKAELIEHTTSGDITGDTDAVVGYAGFLIY